MILNSAAWLLNKRTKLSVEPAPYRSPGPGEIVVRNRALAINPFDWILQTAGDLIAPYIKYPAILGSDLAGEVVEIGADVTRFRPGDRVLAHAIGTDPKRNHSAEGAFQACTVVLSHMASQIPDTMSFEEAAVLPLGLSTAACGLFEKDMLALDYPQVPAKSNGKIVLIWGGATSVGSNAIQLAVSAGYEVITTSSPKNFDYVRGLGASQVFDYKARSAVRDIIAALKGKTFVGALAIGSQSALACLDIVGAAKGAKSIAMASFPIEFDKLSQWPGATVGFMAQVPRLAVFAATLWLRSMIHGVRIQAIYGSSLAHNEVGSLIYQDFLPLALATGQFRPAPRASIVGEGLAYIQTGLDVQKAGMSAAKVVISLS